MSPPKAKKRGRKKSTKRTARKKVARRTAKSGREDARDLVLSRDQRVMKVMSGDDPQEAYRLAADVDEYLDKLAKLL